MAISIQWVEGGRYAKPEDTDRAQAAALAALAAAGITDHVAAEAAFRAAMDRGAADPDPATDPMAAAWQAAEEAANAACTEGWHDPNGGAVQLNAWAR
jgi:hypothetical protein